MPKRTLAVLGMAAFAGLALQFGVPQVARASGPTYTTLVLSPLPIAQPGTLNPSSPSTNTVQLCVQPQSGGVHVGAGAQMYLSIDAGLFTSPSRPGGSAVAGTGATTLTQTPALFTVSANCTYDNASGTGTTTEMDAVPVTYTGPNPVPINGRDVIVAQNAPTLVTGGQCPGGDVCNTGTYVFSPVTAYDFNPPAPIAPTGSLAPGQKVPFTVTAMDSTSHGVPGAFLDISLTSTGSGGSATVINYFTSNPAQPVKNSPVRLGANNVGQTTVTYTAANVTNDTDTITIQNHLTVTVENTTTYTYSGTTPPPAPGPYTAITPFRVCDTRPALGGVPSNQCNTGSTGAGSGPIGELASRVVTIGGFGSPAVPADAVAVVLNVTAIAPTKNDFLTLYPDLQSRPNTSNINLLANQVRANLVEVQLSSAGKIDVFNDQGTINVALDIEGFVSPGSSTAKYNALSAPVRICDTRATTGSVPANQCNTSGHSPILGSGPVLTFNVDSQSDGVPPSGVVAVVFNLTAISPSVRTDLTAYPAGVTEPLASNVNAEAGTAVPNRVIVGVSGSGTVSIANSVGSVDVAIDIDGYFASTGSEFQALTPARVCNTQFGNPNDSGCNKATIGPGGVLNIDVTGIDGVSPSATAVVVNVTAVNATTGTLITVYPGTTGLRRPNASDLNVGPTWPVANLVVVGVDPTTGTINLYNNLGNVNLIVDVYGYYS